MAEGVLVGFFQNLPHITLIIYEYTCICVKGFIQTLNTFGKFNTAWNSWMPYEIRGVLFVFKIWILFIVIQIKWNIVILYEWDGMLK